VPKVINSDTVGLLAGTNTSAIVTREEAVDDEVEYFEPVADRRGDDHAREAATH